MTPGMPVRRLPLRRRSHALAILLLSLLCLWPAPPARAVIGGEEMRMEFMMTRYVVGIRYEDESGAKKICAGAIIGPSIVLTAAHCIPRDRSTMSVVFGDSMRPDRAVAELAVAGVRVHEKYEFIKDLPLPDSNDLAVIRTKDPLPSAARHMQLAASLFPVSQIPTVYVAGYGAIGVGRDGKAVGQGQLHSAIAHRAADKDRMYEQNLMIVVDQSKGTGICIGDGGAPMLVENKEGFILMGIASVIFVADNGSNPCGGTTAFVNVHAFEEWIIQQAFELMQVYK
ncbi:MAG TPA: trypsin-like serine protease [Pseudolabrys sp.]|nr:trypsin-like serine protease [Pseudolabrys sp.]